MKTIKKLLGVLSLALISMSFSQCASTMELEQEAPTKFGEVYTKSWVAGVKGGGSGTNIFIEVKDESIVLDSVFYKGELAKLTTKPANKTLFIGRFLSNRNRENSNLIEETKPKEVSKKKLPFDLKDDECVVSYIINGKTKYYKLGNVVNRKSNDALPMSAPPNKN